MSDKKVYSLRSPYRSQVSEKYNCKIPLCEWIGTRSDLILHNEKAHGIGNLISTKKRIYYRNRRFRKQVLGESK